MARVAPVAPAWMAPVMEPSAGPWGVRVWTREVAGGVAAAPSAATAPAGVMVRVPERVLLPETFSMPTETLLRPPREMGLGRVELAASSRRAEEELPTVPMATGPVPRALEAAARRVPGPWPTLLMRVMPA